ncbi:WD repeat-containing protein 7 isoform X4 [Aplysia californica]|uniref:WD repeat-containing protein 7 isoform X4 n=1 Tax=Aplysia californica TaxID=6500 RepID=A0ABM1VP60_APLCA|nr:WD repeat-containing protein 7 isoform X4 [Aplysia californica]
MATGSSLVVPMVLWGRRAPTHCISTILMTPDGKFIVTGCNDGQICVWDVLEHFQVAPRHMLFGHTAAISCLAVGSEHKERRYVVSSSENGEMCLWDVSDGRCVENTKTDKVHSDIVAFHLKSSKALRLICNGYYDEVVIIDPLNLEIVYSLVARVESDWVSACCVLSPPSRDDDVILAITNSGSVKVWTLSMPESKGNKVPEDESKQIRCLNAQTLKCCPGNLRTVLIVCSKYWQIYDASDFTLLCSESNRRGERWTGGDFLSVDRVIVWSNEGRGYLYKLPTKLLKLPSLTKRTWLTKWKVPEGSLAKSLLRGKAVARAKQKLKSRQCLSNPDHKDYHRAYSQTSVHAYYVLDIFTEHGPLDCSPALTYMSCGVGERATHLMLRGDSDGRVTVWALPQVSEKQMTLVRQESFDRLPALSPKSSTTLQDSWKVMSSSPPGILDGICEKADEQRELKDSNTEIFITATIYIPSQGKIVCGRNNGTIVIVPGIDCIKSQLLSGQSSAPSPKILYGHHGRVTCLLYPFNESTRYEPHHLLSGGSDFSVVLWDVNGGVKIHTFTVHGGSLSHMTVPPANCNPRILSCICSVAGDHSVALLSLKERKCLLLASRHLYPVKLIKWRPLDDFMLVQTKDGVVTVWQMETGHLDRVIDGKTAEDVLSNCDENATPVEALTNPSITLAQALKRRNLATFRNLAQQKLQMGGHANQPSPGHKSELVKPTGFPLLIQGIKTNTRDPDAHVLFFDTEALIVHLLTEEYALLSPAELEARGMNVPEKALSAQSDLSEAQQKLSAAGFEALDRVSSFEIVNPHELSGGYCDEVFEEEQDVDGGYYGLPPQAYQASVKKHKGPSLTRRGLSLDSGKFYSSPLPSPVKSYFSPPQSAPVRTQHQVLNRSQSSSKFSPFRPFASSKLFKKSGFKKQLSLQHDNPQPPPRTKPQFRRAPSAPGVLSEAKTLPLHAKHTSSYTTTKSSVTFALENRSPSPNEGVPVLDVSGQGYDSGGFLAKAKEKAETVGQKIQSKMEAVSSSGSSNSAPIQTQPASSRASKRPDYISIQESLSMAIGELFMSCLHAWGLDPQLDDLCVGKLGLHKPRCPISFGLLSHGGHMSLMLPGWHRQQTSHKDVLGAAAASGPSAKLPTLLTQRTGQAPFEVDKLSDHDNDEAAVGGEDKGAPGGQAVKVSSVRPASPANNARRTSSLGSNQQQAYDFSTKINCPQLRWQISSAVTTQHLLSVISVANTLMGMSRAAFLPEMQVPMHRSRKETVSSNHGMVLRETDSPESVTSSEDTSSDAQATIQAQVKQGWSLLAALHCVLLPELVGPTIYQCPQLEMLARRWQDRCLEIREAAQALLLAELRRINPEGRKVLLDKWAPFLPSYVDPELSLLSNMGGHHEAVEEDDDEEDGILAGDIPAHKLSVSFESRRKQATAIVMLGVIGAEFGQEMEPSRTKASEEQKKVKVKGSVEGFSLTNYSLARHTSKALTFLLLQPPSPRLPLHTPIRRAAIDLIGRGFTVWEPYLDVSAVLLGLLELSIDSNKLIPRKGHLVRSKEDYEQLDCTTYGLPLSPAADACRSARHALSLIATARPPAFIITMAKEVARFNALAQNAQSQSAHLQNIILARASAEILHIVELLVEKIPNDVADLIVEAMDVSMFCLDLAALKTKGLPELFPAICRFSMVAYCHQTKRVWVGARNGHLALYEMKQHSRCQMLPAHQGPITAVAVNQDGKYLATFSHMDHKLRFWQTASSSLFGIGSQQTKLVRTHNTPAISVSPISNILKLVRLVWVDKTTVVLLTVDGQELKYSVH